MAWHKNSHLVQCERLNPWEQPRLASENGPFYGPNRPHDAKSIPPNAATAEAKPTRSENNLGRELRPALGVHKCSTHGALVCIFLRVAC